MKNCPAANCAVMQDDTGEAETKRVQMKKRFRKQMETASKRLRRRRRKFSSGILHPKVVTWEWLHSLRTIHSKILLH
jgi:hypothetical protein